MSTKRVSRGGCPVCEKTIPFSRAMLRRGTAFSCARCATPIVLSKASGGLAVAAFASLSFLSGKVPGLLILAIVAAALLFEWLLSPVRLAESSDARLAENAEPKRHPKADS